MTAKITLLGVLLALTLHGVASANPPVPPPPCKPVRGMRIDTAKQYEEIRNACEITDNLAIFPEGIKEMTFPNLKSVRFLNIEADDLEAINFPALEKVDYLFIRSGDLKVAEFPRLKRVAATMSIKTRNLKFLHLPNLRTVGHMYLINNLGLEAMFIDKLYDIRLLEISGNPRLAAGTEALLKGLAWPLTPEQKKEILESEKKIRELKIKLAQDMRVEMPPTGHATSFNSFGSYYQSYPVHFWSYWNYIRPWGYHRNYFGWWN